MQSRSDRDGLGPADRRAARRAGCASLGPVAATARSSTTSSARAPTCRSGWTDEQDGGTTACGRRDDEACSATPSARTPGSSFLLPPELRLWQARRGDGGGLRATEERRRPAALRVPRRALLRAARASAIQDRVLLAGRTRSRLRARGARTPFIVAVNCGQAGGTCFCVSMGTGPRADAGFDLALTELLDDGGHRFVVEAGSDAGAEVLARAAGTGRRRRRTWPRAERVSERAASRWAARWTTDGHHGAAVPQPRAPALGRGRRALPDLRQLHDGLPDLLLHARSRT